MTTIVHILSDATLTGAPRQVLGIVEQLDKKQFNTIVIGPTGPIETEFKRIKTDYISVNFGGKFDLPAINRLRAQLKKIVDKNDNVIVHCHGPRAGLFGRLAAKPLPVKIAYTEHSWTADYHLPNPLNSWLQMAALRYLDRYTDVTIGVSQAVIDFLTHQKISRKDKTVLIYNGIALPAQPLPLVQTHTIGSIGSLSWQKNYLFLLDVAAAIKNQVPGIKFEIIGSGPQEKELREKIKTLQLQKIVSLVSAVPHEKLNEHYKHWSLYIQPSVNESFGLALAEAIGAGIPAIGARVGSIPEIISDLSATFVSDKLSDAVACIEHYITGFAARAALREQQWLSIQQFDIERTVTAHEKLYRGLISQ